MLNTDIKYNLSRDYHNLFTLLKSGNIIIGFSALSTSQNTISREYSKVTTMSYNEKFKSFNLGFTFFNREYEFDDFFSICVKYNVQYFPLVAEYTVSPHHGIVVVGANDDGGVVSHLIHNKMLLGQGRLSENNHSDLLTPVYFNDKENKSQKKHIETCTRNRRKRKNRKK